MAICGGDLIDREELEKHLAALHQQERAAFATWNATKGAIQFCEHLLKQCDLKSEPNDDDN